MNVAMPSHWQKTLTYAYDKYEEEIKFTDSASSIHVCFLSSSSTPIPITARLTKQNGYISLDMDN